MDNATVDNRSESRPGPVLQSALVAHYAWSLGGALYLYHVILPALRKSGRLIVDGEPYPAPTLSAQ